MGFNSKLALLASKLSSSSLGKLLTIDSNGDAAFVDHTSGFRNRIINGAMEIDQRNSGASVTPVNAQYTLDRWSHQLNQASKFSVQQNAGAITPPAGFSSYLGVTSTSAYTVLTGDYFTVEHKIEGTNMVDFAWGTASAKTITMSFWVRSSLTGTFGGALRNNANTRSYPFTYTISASNTWEYKTITIAGDTSGTWLTTTGVGMYIHFGLGAGSTFSGTGGAWASANYLSATGATSVVGTNGATFYLTGVQLEVGSAATAFERRSYSEEIILCQRYLPAFNIGNGADVFRAGAAASTTLSDVGIPFMVQPRVAPTGISTSAASTFTISGITTGSGAATAIAFSSSGIYSASVRVTTTGGSPTLVAGQAVALLGNSSTSQILFTGCEL